VIAKTQKLPQSGSFWLAIFWLAVFTAPCPQNLTIAQNCGQSWFAGEGEEAMRNGHLHKILRSQSFV